MHGTDFLLTFDSNAAAEIAKMRAYEAQVLATQRAINQTQSASRNLASGNGGNPIGLNASQLGALTPATASLTGQLGRLQAEMRAIRDVGLEPTLGQVRREMTLMNQLALQGGPAFAEFGKRARDNASALRAKRAELDSTSDAFGRHVGRIQETILVYAAFAAAATAATSAVTLATTIDRESRRLEAVLDLNPQQGRDFIGGVGQVAISSVTPFEDLLAQEDLIASAFANTEDPIRRQAQALELTNDVGRITTVTQRDVATETQNLIAIMQQAGLPVEQLGDKLGKVVVAGNNSSTSISAILDALRIATPAAKLAGVGFDELITMIGLFRQETQRGGSEIGSTFKTLFQTITQPEAENNLKEITDGLVSIRDAEGNIRPVLDILVELRTLVDSGAIAGGKLNDIFKALAPPLNPGAAQDIAIIFDTLKELPTAFRDVSSAGENALQQLVDKINDSLGPQFQKFIEEVKVGFFNLFGQEILDTGQGIIDLLRAVGDVLNALPPDLVVAVGNFLALTVAFKGLKLIGGALVPLIGLGGIQTAIASASAAAAASGVPLSIMEKGLIGVGAAARAAIPLLLAFAAIQAIGGAVEAGEKEAALRRAGIGEQTSTLAVHPEGRLKGSAAFEAGLLGPKLTDTQFTNLDRLGTALVGAEKGGTSTPESIERMRAAVVDLNGVVKDQLVSVNDIIAAGSAATESNDQQTTSLDALYEKYMRNAEGIQSLTAEQRIANEATQIQTELAGDVAKKLETLTDRYRKGSISASEYAAGQEQVSRASELAAQLVAAVGGQLGQIPELADAAAQGNDALAAAIFEMIVKSGDQLPVIDQLISKIVGIAAAAQGAAAVAAANPIIIRSYILEPQSVKGNLAIGGFFEGTDRGQAGMGTTFNVARRAPVVDTSAITSQITSLISGLMGALRGGTSTPFGFTPSFGSTRTGSGVSAPTPDLIDLGDFPADKLAQAIALAQKLQNAIPGANADAKDEVLNIIKDAEFLKQIKGLDSELLQKAIERLTDIEEARLALEKQRAPLLSNLQVNQGGLSSLITQPVTFGTDGSFIGGTGFNTDPSQQGIVVNIGTISGQALTQAQISAIMYNAIAKALADAAKL